MSAELADRLRRNDGSTLICLDYMHYARRLFGTGEKRWFDGVQLLNLFRQAQQGTQADIILFPLLDWISAWRNECADGAPAGASPIKALRTALADPRLVVALTDVMHALATLNGSKATLAFLIGDPARWLAWAGGTKEYDNTVDEADAEDVSVYLSSLLHQLPMTGVGALFMHHEIEVDGDISLVYSPLINTAHHYGLMSVMCSAEQGQLPDGFDHDATYSPVVCEQDDVSAQSQALPAGLLFRVGVIPEEASPESVIAALARWRMHQI